MFTRLVGSVLVLMAVAVASPQIHDALAATVPGTPVTISGLDAMTATVNEQAKNGIGRILALGLGVVGLCIVASSYVGTGVIVALAAVAMAFFPGIIDTAFTATAAAPLVPGAVAVPWAAWYAPLASLFYSPMLAWKIIQDPVLLSAFGLMSLTRHLRHRVGAQLAN